MANKLIICLCVSQVLFDKWDANLTAPQIFENTSGTDCGSMRRWNSPSLSLPLWKGVRTRSLLLEDRSVFPLFSVLKTVYFSRRFVFLCVCHKFVSRRVWRVSTPNTLPFRIVYSSSWKIKLWASVYRNNTYSLTYPKSHLEPLMIEKRRLIKWPRARRSSACVAGVRKGYEEIFLNFLVGVGCVARETVHR